MQVRHPEAHSFAWTQLHLNLSDEIETLSTRAGATDCPDQAAYLRDMAAALQDALEALPTSERATAPSERLIPHTAAVFAASHQRLASPGYAEGRTIALGYMCTPRRSAASTISAA